LSQLNNAPNRSPAVQPNNSAAVTSCSTPASVTVSTSSSYTYCGTLTGTTWVLSGTGTIRNPANPGKYITRTLTRTVAISGTNSGANVSSWNRIYSDTTGNCSVDVPSGAVIQGNFAAKGDVCLTGAGITGTNTTVQIGGKLTLTPDNTANNDAEYPGT